MKMGVILTHSALSDMIDIGDYIAQDNPERAKSFCAEIKACCEALADNPLAYPLLINGQHKNIRKRVFGKYLIFYHIRKDTVEILHIWHNSRLY